MSAVPPSNMHVKVTMLQHKSAPFKVAERYHWMVILSNRKHIEELLRASDDVLSSGINEVRNRPVLPELCHIKCCWQRLNIYYPLGQEIIDNPHHIAAVRSQLTRNIARLYPEIKDEIVTAFDDVLDLRGNGEEPAFTRVAMH